MLESATETDAQTAPPRRKKYQPTHSEIVARLQAEALRRNLAPVTQFLTVRELATAARESDDSIIRKFSDHPEVVDLNAGRVATVTRKGYRILRIPISVALAYLQQRTPAVQAAQAPATRRKFTTAQRQEMMRNRHAVARAQRRVKALAAAAGGTQWQ